MFGPHSQREYRESSIMHPIWESHKHCESNAEGWTRGESLRPRRRRHIQNNSTFEICIHGPPVPLLCVFKLTGNPFARKTPQKQTSKYTRVNGRTNSHVNVYFSDCRFVLWNRNVDILWFYEFLHRKIKGTNRSTTFNLTFTIKALFPYT